MRKSVKGVVVAGVFGFVCLFFQLPLRSASSPIDDADVSTTIGNIDTFWAGYGRWKAAMEQFAQDRQLQIGLRERRLATESVNVHGQATFDLTNGDLVVEVSGLPATELFDVWLIDKRSDPSRVDMAELSPKHVHAGRLRPGPRLATLQANLGRDLLTGFHLDLVVIAEQGKDPMDDGRLFGSPTLFQKLYYGDQQGLAKQGLASTSPGSTAAPFRAIVPSPAYAQEFNDDERLTFPGNIDLNALTAKGEDLFFNETFDGNGRTCGTCHPINDSLTLGPADIAALPSDNPLFVAETIPQLAGLERPMLMREFGLILENVDGFQNPTTEFTMRAIPHMLSLALTITNGSDRFPRETTGWSTDGAPDANGTLRDFLKGAIRQHFPKTLNRCFADDPDCGPADFRSPTDDELDAVEAFLLSLGRPRDPDLRTFELRSADARKGLKLFNTISDQGGSVPAAKCAMCHFNGGANLLPSSGLLNGTTRTGVEDDPRIQERRELVENFPVDGGRGLNPSGGFDTRVPNADGGFGDGTFNVPPLIEAADTAPLFHNNLAATIEEAVAFYASDTFNDSPATALVGNIELTERQIEQVAKFLRTLNALENIRTALSMEQRALRALETQANVNIDRLLGLARADTQDAVEVLSEVGLNESSIPFLRDANADVERALASPAPADRTEAIQSAVSNLKSARLEICEVGDLLCEDPE